ncbi:uncharacterized protein ARMOST_00446 [Armillaria ostoyae]|uniref:Uncharacterized protein n=1 Tax=Armillaria ostoyae TaxID=47428 RepID=A0A284QL70_ARMOS|nr:uncharacterized protein ARMOST_00446 [Armillaria ostoyae]
MARPPATEKQKQVNAARRKELRAQKRHQLELTGSTRTRGRAIRNPVPGSLVFRGTDAFAVRAEGSSSSGFSNTNGDDVPNLQFAITTNRTYLHQLSIDKARGHIMNGYDDMPLSPALLPKRFPSKSAARATQALGHAETSVPSAIVQVSTGEDGQEIFAPEKVPEPDELTIKCFTDKLLDQRTFPPQWRRKKTMILDSVGATIGGIK